MTENSVPEKQQFSNIPPSTPLYLGGNVVAIVEGDELFKSIDGPKHFLRRPAGIAFDVAIIEAAQQAGAERICVMDRSTRWRYRTTMERVRRDGFYLSRGYGRQVALELCYWSINGERPSADVQAARTNAGIKALQPGLFGGWA